MKIGINYFHAFSEVLHEFHPNSCKCMFLQIIKTHYAMPTKCFYSFSYPKTRHENMRFSIV